MVTIEDAERVAVPCSLPSGTSLCDSPRWVGRFLRRCFGVVSTGGTPRLNTLRIERPLAGVFTKWGLFGMRWWGETLSGRGRSFGAYPRPKGFTNIF